MFPHIVKHYVLTFKLIIEKEEIILPTKHQSSSEILLELVAVPEHQEKFTYRSIIKRLDKRAFGIGILLFSLPLVLPFSMIPGFSALFSIPIVIFAIQMIFARKVLWLPRFIADREIPRAKLTKVIKITVPYLKKIEHLLKPRWAFMETRVAEFITGVFIFLLAILLMLPIPFSNIIYSGILVLLSLGIVEKDGLVITIGVILSSIALGLIPFVINLVKNFFF